MLQAVVRWAVFSHCHNVVFFLSLSLDVVNFDTNCKSNEFVMSTKRREGGVFTFLVHLDKTFAIFLN